MLLNVEENRSTNLAGIIRNVIMAAYWKIKCGFTAFASWTDIS